jgi:ubiquitin-like modifier-activating enzyme ATG7
VINSFQSLRDATLDQQCTVTRPGIAPIASALLVELLVSILQHPLRARAPATTAQPLTQSFMTAPTSPSSPTSPSTNFVHPLGQLPHQLRGFLSSWSVLSIVGQPYPQCSACSDSVVDAYQKDGWDFVKKAIGEKGFVEEISGLAEVQRAAEAADAEVDWEEDDEDGDGELI